jgi:hypothetical protein
VRFISLRLRRINQSPPGSHPEICKRNTDDSNHRAPNFISRRVITARPLTRRRLGRYTQKQGLQFHLRFDAPTSPAHDVSPAKWSAKGALRVIIISLVHIHPACFAYTNNLSAGSLKTASGSYFGGSRHGACKMLRARIMPGIIERIFARGALRMQTIKHFAGILCCAGICVCAEGPEQLCLVRLESCVVLLDAKPPPSFNVHRGLWNSQCECK